MDVNNNSSVGDWIETPINMMKLINNFKESKETIHIVRL